MSQAIIYSTEICPYCVKAKALLKLQGVEYKEITVDISTQKAKDEYKRNLSEKTGVPISTVPQIFLDDEYIGGFDDLDAHFAKQEVKEMSGDFSDFDL